MYISVQKLRPHAQIPKRATAQSAGYDLYALPEEPLTIQPQEICKGASPASRGSVPSGRCPVHLPSLGLSTKHGITLINSVGLVDSDYRGELLIPLINHGSEPFTVEAGMRIAQLVVLPILTPELKEVTRLDTTERGAGGFGASGLS
ncbi:MAG: dUTP diphosphatase [Ruminococcus callidus]